MKDLPDLSQMTPQPLSRRMAHRLRQLHRRKYRQQYGLYLVEGPRLLASARAAGVPLEAVVVDRERLEAYRALLPEDVPVYVTDAATLETISTVQHSQGILAVARLPAMEEGTWLEARTVVALDGLQDPGNVGTIVRAAAWFGVEAVLAGPETADFFHPKVVRATMGGLWDVHLARTANLAEALRAWKARGRPVWGGDLEGLPLPAWHPPEEGMLVVGQEARGLSPEVRTLLDERLYIPGAPRRRGVESLNAAVAAGIFLYHWRGTYT